MKCHFRFQLFSALLFPALCSAQGKAFPVVTKATKATIVYSNEVALDSIAAHLLASDIERVTAYRPVVTNDITTARGHVIVIGTVRSALVQLFAGRDVSFTQRLSGQWECYGVKVMDNPIKGITKALVIAGSDTRGTAYGVFSISEKIGVSPWYWWADVPVKRSNELVLMQKDYVSSPPSVKYRGIFINDEDWGLLPWAKNTFEPHLGNIGPKTYAKVFELLLRLKANMLWPAMHPGTAPFYIVPGNKEAASRYSIVIGTSHAEPMLRNNVGEWDEKTMGRFNYITNKENVYQYWQRRVQETAKDEVIYTLGMRGVHDSGMEGVRSPKEAVPLIEGIIKDQRALLEKYSGKDATAIPQAFTAYKEVLDIYDAGLKIPDDVTLVWPDDNYGYIHQLNSEKEKGRSGGSGVYYHASYWGRPHDYLWLSTTHPSLIRSEMMKAYETGADRIWILNVGDIKPLEYNIQLFMDMAYNVSAFKESSYTRKHLGLWLENIFGQGMSGALTAIMWQYYNLAFERRPEFMGWSQTEPTTTTKYTSYNHFSYGDEADWRMRQYEILADQVTSLKTQSKNDAAFYQLVYYPVVCASWMNKKFLCRDKAYVYAKQNRISAYEYAALSKAAYDSIVKETAYYNEQLSGGKWKGIMSMKPRDLPVFHAPDIMIPPIDKTGTWDAVPEGYDTIAYQHKAEKKLPTFVKGSNRSYFIDIFLNDSVTVEWTATASAPWIRLSAVKSVLNPARSSFRVWAHIDWTKHPKQNGSIEIIANGKKETIRVTTLQPAGLSNYIGALEDNGIVSIEASRYQSKTDKPGCKWQLAEGLGHTNTALQAFVTSVPDTVNIEKNSAHAAYYFYTFSDAPAKIYIHTLPTHPLNKNVGARYGISIDGSPVKIINFKTVGRSEEWKQNVLRNAAIKEIEFPKLKPGKHALKIYAIDPAVVLDRIVVKLQ